MKKMSKIKEPKIYSYHFCIYPRILWVVKGKCDKFIQEHFTERCGEEIVFEDESGSEASCTVLPNVCHKESGKYGYLVYIKDIRASVGCIAHEATHVATELFCEIGSYLDPKNQEPFAYIVGFVSDCINDAVNGKTKADNE